MKPKLYEFELGRGDEIESDWIESANKCVRILNKF